MKCMDAGYLHERDKVDIPALICNIETDEERLKGSLGGRVGAPSGPSRKPDSASAPLRRRTEHKNKAGEVPSVLAWDDLTNMKLEAGRVK